MAPGEVAPDNTRKNGDRRGSGLAGGKRLFGVDMMEIMEEEMVQQVRFTGRAPRSLIAQLAHRPAPLPLFLNRRSDVPRNPGRSSSECSKSSTPTTRSASTGT